jgi:hypothetical protein
MRRLIAILGILLLGSAGCKHVGGKCDCGPIPGEAIQYAPYNNTGVQSTPSTMPEVIGAPKPQKN